MFVLWFDRILARLLVGSLASVAVAGYCGDLSPLVLPTPRQSQATTPSSKATDAREQYYSRFRAEMSSKNRAEREALATEFKRLRDQAGLSETDRLHYQRLVTILSELQ